jgi:NADH-quinone oxidoreductase subunit A
VENPLAIARALAFVGSKMELAEYLPVLVQGILAIGIAAVILVASHIFGQRSPTNRLKDAAYECGLPAEGRPGARFSVKFYVTAMLFILFDIEVVFLIPLVLVYRDFLAEGLPIFLPFMFFLLVLVVGLYYEVRKGALEWDK